MERTAARFIRTSIESSPLRIWCGTRAFRAYGLNAGEHALFARRSREAHLNIVRVGGVSGRRLARWTKLVQAAPGFAAYQEMDRWIKAMDLPQPVTIVSSPDEVTAGEPPGSTSLLQRLLPFTFRRPPHSAPLATTEVPFA
jgi:hypothetical protein